MFHNTTPDLQDQDRGGQYFWSQTGFVLNKDRQSQTTPLLRRPKVIVNRTMVIWRAGTFDVLIPTFS